MEVNDWSAYKLEKERLYEKSDISLSIAIYSMPDNLKSLFSNYAFSSRDAKFIRKLVGTISESEATQSAFSKWIDENRRDFETMNADEVNKELIARLKDWSPVSPKMAGINKEPQTWATNGKISVSFQVVSKAKSKIELNNATPEQIAALEEFTKTLFG